MTRLLVIAGISPNRAGPALLAIALAFFVAACAKPVPLPEPADVPYGQGRLWQVDRPGEPSSYVFGTIHVTDPRVFELPDAVEMAFVNADIALFEADYRRRATREELSAYIDLPEGQSLIDLLGHITYRKLQRLIFRHRLKLYNYYRHQPWVTWMALSDREIEIGIRQDSERPVLDDWLALRARKAKREVGFLETSAEQWKSLSALSMDDQVAMLKAAIDSYYEARVRVDKIAVYLDGNFALSYALWERRLGHLGPDLARRYAYSLLNDRNHRMVERMLPHMAERSVFVAVGALHLPGEEGILSLLEQRGYRVTRVY